MLFFFEPCHRGIVDELSIFREVAEYFGKKRVPSPEQTRNENNKLIQANQSTQ